MNTLRSAPVQCHVRVPRMRVVPSHSSARTRGFWQQVTVRPGRPSHHSTAELSPSGSSILFPHAYLPPRLVPHRWCTFRQLAQQAKTPPQSSVSSAGPPVAPKVTITNAEQRRRDWAIVRRLAVHIWPKSDWGTRGRVVLGVGLLIGGKVRLPGPVVQFVVR
jgi:hypothetical protein